MSECWFYAKIQQRMNVAERLTSQSHNIKNILFLSLHHSWMKIDITV